MRREKIGTRVSSWNNVVDESLVLVESVESVACATCATVAPAVCVWRKKGEKEDVPL